MAGGEMADRRRNPPREKTCGCGATYVGSNASKRCPRCRALFNKVYDHAYERGIYLNEGNWRDYGREHGLMPAQGER